MNPAQRETFRTAILSALDERGGQRFGLTLFGLGIFLAQYGFPHPARADLSAELEYLADKGLVAGVGKVISPENRSWRITAAGRDFLAQQFPE